MTAYAALVSPRLGTTDGPGWCLRFAQSFFGAPARHDSAWEAWEAQEIRHGAEVPLPDVPVLLWFEHWGTYGPKGQERYGNWGDVRIHVPGDAIYGSPITGTERGQSRVAHISDIERGIGATYVGWSEDINGLQVAAPIDPVEDDMTPEQAGQLKAVYDAIFTTKSTSRGTRGGVLTTLKAIDDGTFKDSETSFGTPGGTLATLAVVLDQQALIMKHLGIEPVSE